MGMNIEVNITDSPEKLAKRVAKAIRRMLQESGQGRFDIALSGGSTPGILFDRLAKKFSDLPEWKRVHLWWGDERCVDPDSEESNYRMAYDRLISRVMIPVENVHRIKGEDDPEEEADRYQSEIRTSLNHRGKWPVFDLVLLGMGDDGHTASLFPDRPDLMHSDRICEVVSHPQTGQRRISFTGQVINNANQIFIMVTGSGKAERISEIMNNLEQAADLPVSQILPLYGKLTWYLDSDAAAGI
jgi:6-phosphogluconolactonase